MKNQIKNSLIVLKDINCAVVCALVVLILYGTNIYGNAQSLNVISSPNLLDTNLHKIQSNQQNKENHSITNSENTILLTENLLLDYLKQALIREYSINNGELELRLSRQWSPVVVPAKGYSLRLVDAPARALSPSLLLKVEWRNENEVFGQWQLVVFARLWREVIVSAKPLTRGTTLSELSDSDITKVRRDVLQLKEWLEELPPKSNRLELIENIPQGQFILLRHFRQKPLVNRGQLAEAYYQDGLLTISLKVEVLEDGVEGQYVKIRNPQTRRELKGKVQNDGTIQILL